MRKVYFATTNEHKFATLKRFFNPYKEKPHEIELVWEKLEIPEPIRPDVERIVREKLGFVSNFLYERDSEYQDCITMDSGFFIKSLNGFPGTIVHKFFDKFDDEVGLDILLKLVEGNPRECDFCHAIAYSSKNEPRNYHVFSSTSSGIVAERKTGPDTGRPLDRIYIPNGWGDRTLAEIKNDGDYESFRKKRYEKYIRGIADFICDK